MSLNHSQSPLVPPAPIILCILKLEPRSKVWPHVILFPSCLMLCTPQLCESIWYLSLCLTHFSEQAPVPSSGSKLANALFFVAAQYSIVCVCHNFFIFSSVRYLGSFYFLVIVLNVAMPIVMYISLPNLCFFCSGGQCQVGDRKVSSVFIYYFW